MAMPRWLRKRLIAPVLQLLLTGATPERLAWSLAVGFVIGTNPLLGSTTVLALMLAPMFRVNVVASQMANHVVYPLQLALFPVFVRLGSLLFHTAALPLGRSEFLHGAKTHPWQTTRLLWMWEWHALVVWAAFAVIAAPLVATATKPMLDRLLSSVDARAKDGAMETVLQD